MIDEEKDKDYEILKHLSYIRAAIKANKKNKKKKKKAK